MNPFNENPGGYDSWYDENPEMYSMELQAIRELLPDMEKCLSLEIGIGTGRFGIPLGFTHGIDPGKNLVQRLQGKSIAVKRGVAEDLPYGDHQFDVVGIFTALEFFALPQQALKEVSRVLKPDGVLVIAFLNPEGPMGQRLVAHQEEDPWFKHAKLYALDELEALLEEARFSIVNQRQIIMIEDELKLEDCIGDGLYTVIRAEKRA